MLARLELRQDEIARRCGVVRSAAGHWISGRWRPRDEHRVMLRDAYGIPLVSWVEAPEQARADC